jgi:hypothetical protein
MAREDAVSESKNGYYLKRLSCLPPNHSTMLLNLGSLCRIHVSEWITLPKVLGNFPGRKLHLFLDFGRSLSLPFFIKKLAPTAQE